MTRFKFSGLALGAAMSAFLAFPAAAQNAFPNVTQSWYPMGKVSGGITATSSSAATKLPNDPTNTTPSGGTTAWVCNTGTNDGYVAPGKDNTVTASATANGSTYVKAATCSAVSLIGPTQASPYTYLAAISASGTTLSVEVGMGTPPAAISSTGGGGGGGAVTMASGAVAAGAYSAGSLAIGAGVDGWNITEGSTTDAASTAGGAGSMSAKLRLMTTQLGTINTSLAPLNYAQGSTTLGQLGNLVQGAVTAAAPSYTTAQTSPLSLTVAGQLRTQSNLASGSVLSGAYASGSIASGAMVDLGAQGDAACGTATGSCSLIALTKFLNTSVNSPVPLNVNGTTTAQTGLTPGVAQTGTIVAANVDMTSLGGVAFGAMANFGTSPGAVKVQGVNAALTNLGATAIDTNSGNKSAGTQRNVLATDQLALAAWGHGATSATAPTGATQAGVDAQSAEPTKATTGQMMPAMGDLVGKVVTSPFSNRENQLSCAVTLTATTSATTCTGMGAQGAGVKIYITDLTCTRSDAGTTSATMTLNDGATTIIDMPNNGGGGGFSKSYNTPLQIAANTAFQVQSGTSLTSVHCSATGFKGY